MPNPRIPWQAETRNALWAALHAESDWLAAFGNGTEYQFIKGQLVKRHEPEPSKCPMLAIFPASTELPPVSRKTLGGDVDRYRVSAEIVTVELDDAEILVYLFHASMRSQWATLATVRDNRLYQIDASVEYEPMPAKDAPRPLWLAAITLTCRYRQA